MTISNILRHSACALLVSALSLQAAAANANQARMLGTTNTAAGKLTVYKGNSSRSFSTALETRGKTHTAEVTFRGGNPRKCFALKNGESMVMTAVGTDVTITRNGNLLEWRSEDGRSGTEAVPNVGWLIPGLFIGILAGLAAKDLLDNVEAEISAATDTGCKIDYDENGEPINPDGDG